MFCDATQLTLNPDSVNPGVLVWGSDNLRLFWEQTLGESENPVATLWTSGVHHNLQEKALALSLILQHACGIINRHPGVGLSPRMQAIPLSVKFGISFICGILSLVLGSNIMISCLALDILQILSENRINLY